MENPFALLDARLTRMEVMLEKVLNRFSAGIEEVDELLNVQKAAHFLNLAVPTVYAMVQRSEIPFCKKAKRLYFQKSALKEYILSGLKASKDSISNDVKQYLIKPKNKKK
jgi:excisionase family DNA binding protein